MYFTGYPWSGIGFWSCFTLSYSIVEYDEVLWSGTSSQWFVYSSDVHALLISENTLYRDSLLRYKVVKHGNNWGQQSPSLYCFIRKINSVHIFTCVVIQSCSVWHVVIFMVVGWLMAVCVHHSRTLQYDGCSSW